MEKRRHPCRVIEHDQRARPRGIKKTRDFAVRYPRLHGQGRDPLPSAGQREFLKQLTELRRVR